jgi:hypothetical protein
MQGWKLYELFMVKLKLTHKSLGKRKVGQLILSIYQQGKRILILQPKETSQNLEQVVWLPAGQEAFSLDASFAGFLLFE